MTWMRLIIPAGMLLGLSACGGPIELACDDVRAYQLAAEGKRVEAPDDLNDLEPLKEMPLPEASPQPQRSVGSPCLDLPPMISVSE